MFSGFTRSDTTLEVYLKGTSGINLNFNSDPWKVFSSFYYQYGKDVNQGLVKTSSAYNFNLQAEFKATYFMLQGGCSLLSGDKQSEAVNGTTHLFDVLYGARHKYYGYLDYFNNLRKSTRNGGLNDFYATIGVPIVPKVDVFGSCHAFYLNQVPSYLDNSSNASGTSYLASEFDFWLKADVWKGINILTGYSFMLPGHHMKVIQNVSGDNPFSSWAWVMVTFSVKSKDL
jgi:hypothetical protein